GIVVSGVGLSPVYIAPLTNMLYKTYGLEQIFLFLGIFALVVICLLSLLLRNPSPSEAAVQASSKSAAQTTTQTASKPAESNQKGDYTWQEMVRMPSFYLLWFAYLMSAAAGLMLIGHMASIADVQANWKAGFLLVVILAVFNFFGRIIGGLLSDKVGRTRALLLVFLIQAANMFAFSFYTEIPTLIAGSALAGLAYGALFALFPAATADLFGLKNLGVNYGLVFTGWGVAGIIGPIVGGLVADATGSYNISYITSAVMLVIGALLVLRMKK
ncbi:MAG: MFS transporter, partial [Bacteroidales bacterium]